MSKDLHTSTGVARKASTSGATERSEGGAPEAAGTPINGGLGSIREAPAAELRGTEYRRNATPKPRLRPPSGAEEQERPVKLVEGRRAAAIGLEAAVKRVVGRAAGCRAMEILTTYG